MSEKPTTWESFLPADRSLVLIRVDLGCDCLFANLVAGRLLQMYLSLAYHDHVLRDLTFIGHGTGFHSLCDAVPDAGTALAVAVDCMAAARLTSHAEIALWDHRELVIRDHASPTGEAFARHLEEIVRWNQWHLLKS